MKYQNILFPKRFNQVMDFYFFQLEPIFFPSYEYHTLSKNGVILRHAVIQTSYNNELYLYVIPELMLNIEMIDLKSIHWSSSGGTRYSLELLNVLVTKSPTIKEHKFGSRSNLKPIITPNYVDLRPICPPIQNQGDLGTCGVAALTSFLEFITEKRLSVLFIYYVTRTLRGHFPHDDSGVEIEDCIAALAKYGICKEESWPYDLIKWSEAPSQKALEEARQFRPIDFKALKSGAEMKETLRKGLPFICDVNFAPETYNRSCEETGIVPGPKSIHELDPESCEHTVLVVGYKDETEEFIFQNSWGTKWGQKGYGLLPFVYMTPGMFRNAYTWKDTSLPIKSFE